PLGEKLLDRRPRDADHRHVAGLEVGEHAVEAVTGRRAGGTSGLVVRTKHEVGRPPTASGRRTTHLGSSARARSGRWTASRPAPREAPGAAEQARRQPLCTPSRALAARRAKQPTHTRRSSTWGVVFRTDNKGWSLCGAPWLQ